MALGYLDNYTVAAVTLYIAVTAISCCTNVGFKINHMDLTTNYAGVLMGLSNSFGATGGFGAPFIVSTFVHDIVRF